MDLYTLFKTLHILAALVWVGGGIGLAIAGFLALRLGSAALLLAIGRLVSLVGPRVFLPASLATLVFGLLMVWTGGLALEAWLVLGLLGTLATALFGQFVLKPRSETAAFLAADPVRRAQAITVTAGLLRLAAFDYVLLVSVVVLMVAKPGWGDASLLAGLAAAAGTAIAAICAARGRVALPAA